LDFAEIVREHQAMVFSLAYHMLRNSAGAEDVAQEVFLRLYRDQAQIVTNEHLVHWLRRTTSHRCLDILRRPINRPHIDVAEIELPDESASATDPFVDRMLRRLVSTLSPTARAVIVLRYQEDLEPREIAALLDLPLATVKSRLQRALALLRAKLSREEGPLYGSARA
jgi:RNA polymerase sigma-70 factor, ECF subfamily